MEEFLIFNNKLNSYISLYSTILVILLIVFCLMVFVVLKFVKDIKLAIITASVGVVISLCVYSFCIYPIQKDLNDQSYITYEGEFYIEEFKTMNRTSTYVFIKTPENEKAIRYTLVGDISNFENHLNCKGKFVYAAKSKFLLEVSINE